MSDLQKIKTKVQEFLRHGSCIDPVFEWETDRYTSMGDEVRRIKIRVYFSEFFIEQFHSRRKEMRKDPQQIYKAIRNTSRGYVFEERRSSHGRDGIFDLNSDSFHNDMTEQLQRVLNDPKHMKRLYSQYSFLSKNSKPVRVVAHPNNIRIRPVGLLNSHDDGLWISQNLLLLALGVFDRHT